MLELIYLAVCVAITLAHILAVTAFHVVRSGRTVFCEET